MEDFGPAVPFVISSSAGGKLAQESGQGYWHGYSVIRLDASGDPTKTVVEQRPILDWLLITAPEHQLRPGQTMDLRGIGRQPAAADTPPRYVRLIDPSITHRYDLVLADAERPWLPYRDSEGEYVAMSDRYPNCSVACIDSQTGEVSTGQGADHRVYGVALLSAGDLSATYPIAFEPDTTSSASSTRASAAALRSGPTPTQRLPSAGSPMSSDSLIGSAAPSGSGFSHFELPAFPSLPPALPVEGPLLRPPTFVSPPALHPASPPPLATSPAEVARAPPGLPDVPYVGLLPPRAPPIQPAPKVNAQRDEAALREAVLAEFEDESPLAVDEALDALNDSVWVDLVDESSLRSAEATRRTPLRPDLPMTARPPLGQPSAWTRNALYGGGLTLAALTLAAGWVGVRRRYPDRAPAVLTLRTPSRRGW